MLPLFGGEKVGYKARNLRGHGVFPKPVDCRMIVSQDHVDTPGLPLSIYYEQMTGVRIMTLAFLSRRDCQNNITG